MNGQLESAVVLRLGKILQVIPVCSLGLHGTNFRILPGPVRGTFGPTQSKTEVVRSSSVLLVPDRSLKHAVFSVCPNYRVINVCLS